MDEPQHPSSATVLPGYWQRHRANAGKAGPLHEGAPRLPFVGLRLSELQAIFGHPAMDGEGEMLRP